jgi:hypothetical protein
MLSPGQINELTTILNSIAQPSDEVSQLLDTNSRWQPWHLVSHVQLRAKAFLQQLKSENFDGIPKNETVGIFSDDSYPFEAFSYCLMALKQGFSVALTLKQKSPLTEYLIQQWKSLHGAVRLQPNLHGCSRIISTTPALSALASRNIFTVKTERAIAVLDGSESEADFERLCTDVFINCGRSPYNAGLLCVPEGYDFIPFLKKAEDYHDLKLVNIYANHYEYQRFTLLMNQKKHLDNGVLVLRAFESTIPPAGVLHYMENGNPKTFPECSFLLSAGAKIPDSKPFGNIQSTGWWNDPRLLYFLQ